MRMRKIVILLLVMLPLAGELRGQENRVEEEALMQTFDRNLDSLLLDWYIQKSMTALEESAAYEADSIPVRFPDSVYMQKLTDLPNVVSLPYNQVVRNYIHAYTETRRDRLEVILGLRAHYFPVIEDIFDSYGVPVELKYMAVIESALNPRAVSRVGAVGMWQFMYSTARMYGLTVNSVVDERRDFVKSTHAAARYIKDLYEMYDDWLLAIAAYNCGPGNVNKAIRRSGNKRNYWDIYYRLPRETRGHIPAFIAVNYVLNHYQDHHIVPVEANLPLLMDTLMVQQDIHLEQVAAVLGLDLQQVRDLNPQYRINVIPGKSSPMALTLPLEKSSEFIRLQDSVIAFNRTAYFNPDKAMANPTRSRYVPTAPTGKAKLTYTVKSGDNLGYIAEWYHVGLSDLRYWNNIYRNLIRVGQKLSVYVDPKDKEKYEKLDQMTFAQKQASIGKRVTKPVPVAAVNMANASEYELYRVKYGDTIWEIAKKYPGVSSDDIMRLNGLSNSRIKVGQDLKIRPKSN